MTHDRTRTYAPRRRRPQPTPEKLKAQAARRRARRRGRTRAEEKILRHSILLSLYAILGLEIVSAALTSPVLAVRRQVVSGLGSLSPAEASTVLHAAKLPNGSNLIRVPVGSISRRIAALPFVKSVEVGRRIPPAVAVTVHPRIAVINAVINGVNYEVDRTGVPIRLTSPEHLSQLAPVVIDSGQAVKLGAPLHNGMVTLAIDLIAKLRQASPVAVAKIEVDQTDSICLNMVDGLRILLGQAEDLDVKISEIHRIYKYEPTIANRLSTVNLTSPSYPACELKNPPPPGKSGPGVSPSGTVDLGGNATVSSRGTADSTAESD